MKPIASTSGRNPSAAGRPPIYRVLVESPPGRFAVLYNQGPKFTVRLRIAGGQSILVIHTASVGHEDNSLAIGREAGMHVIAGLAHANRFEVLTFVQHV